MMCPSPQRDGQDRDDDEDQPGATSAGLGHLALVIASVTPADRRDEWHAENVPN
jgi:hypothetical protein